MSKVHTKSPWITVVHKWDELLTAILFSVFGIAAIIQQPRSQSNTPPFFAILFDIEFILTGIFLLVGILTNNYNLRLLGYALYCIGLLTIGSLIIIASQSVVGLICFAFCFQGFSVMRMLLRDKKAKANLVQIIETLEEDK